jgi:hypothetical protein
VILQALPRAAAQLSIFTHFIRNANDVVQWAGIQIHDDEPCNMHNRGYHVMHSTDANEACGVGAFGPSYLCLFLS